jgi:hypothetical protein
MRHLIIYIFGFFILTSCEILTSGEEEPNNVVATTPPPVPYTPPQPIMPESSDYYNGIKLITQGPRGGNHTDLTGKNFGYRIFRVHVINDTIVPVELSINFPGTPVPLLPGSTSYINVFLFPDTMTPDSIRNIYNFGITKLDSFLNAGLNKPTFMKTLIKPKEHLLLYIGVCDDQDRLARSKLFFNRQNKLNLLYRVDIDPPQFHSLIPCGQIVFKN